MRYDSRHSQKGYLLLLGWSIDRLTKMPNNKSVFPEDFLYIQQRYILFWQQSLEWNDCYWNVISSPNQSAALVSEQTNRNEERFLTRRRAMFFWYVISYCYGWCFWNRINQHWRKEKNFEDPCQWTHNSAYLFMEQLEKILTLNIDGELEKGLTDFFEVKWYIYPHHLWLICSGKSWW